SLVFEQSYGPIEGDSASLAELVTLLSALADVPVAQGIAVTGSVDQHGHVQAVGGVNEKIEGFYELCRRPGLTGEQGVVIPETNLRHLMLDARVVAAVRRGRFHIWPVRTVDEALTLLTGVRAGVRRGRRGWAVTSVNGRVEARLDALAEAARGAAAHPGANGGDPAAARHRRRVGAGAPARRAGR
ncbi:MAG TPA: S16 family serine protease, partial [Solirubrobacteraceae bacterium]|nr:S16 family serine protease [Solirubrobacteraceae bacterium]